MTDTLTPYYGETTHPDCGPETGHVCQEPSGQTCWTEGCDRDAGTKWGPYWCPDHDAARIDRISHQMAKILDEVDAKAPAVDPKYIPRNHGGTGIPFQAHDLTIREGYDYRLARDEWWWKCSCGKSSGVGSKSEGLARAAFKRHLRAVEKAAMA